MHQSLIRNGNHFIRLGPSSSNSFYQGTWFLIDGPWFHFLEVNNIPQWQRFEIPYNYWVTKKFFVKRISIVGWRHIRGIIPEECYASITN